MIRPAIGMMTLFERSRTILKMPEFHPCGVCPTSPAIVPVFSFTSVNMLVRFPVMKSVSKSQIQSSRSSNNPSSNFGYLLCGNRKACLSSRKAGRPALLLLMSQPKSPARRGTSVVPIRATPPPAMSCFIPWDLAPGLSLP